MIAVRWGTDDLLQSAEFRFNNLFKRLDIECQSDREPDSDSERIYDYSDSDSDHIY